MNYDTLGTIVIDGADKAEELIPQLSYRELLGNLPCFTELGVIAEGSLATMLIVARLVDRRRIFQSGLSATDIERALDGYRQRGKIVPIVENALDQALKIVKYAEAMSAG